MKPVLRHVVFAATIISAVLAAGPSPQDALAQGAAPAATSLPEATVRALQEALNRQGIAVKIDGVLNAETREGIRRYQSQHHLPVTGEPDKATLDKLGVAARRGESERKAAPGASSASGQAMGSGMSGSGGMMMSPQMMQSMMQMMMQMMGGGTEMGTGVGVGAGMGMGAMGPGMLYGATRGTQEEMTPERVRSFLEQRLLIHGNPRLRIGKIGPAKDGTILAEIVTVDGSLVQKLAFNRYPGLVRQVTD